MKRALVIMVFPSVDGCSAFSVQLQNCPDGQERTCQYIIDLGKIPDLSCDVPDDDARTWVNRAARRVTRQLEDGLLDEARRELAHLISRRSTRHKK